MTGIKKNAEYYIKRINNLPSRVKESIRDLKKEVAFSRILILSMQELCSRLDIEYTREEFEGNCKKNFAAMVSYLESFDLKPVPCSIPVNLGFADRIFITARPNLQNDEDCCAVNAIIRENRSPEPRDLVHISRMKEKLSNYNIMLRVFEALFIISPEHLGTHQRACLNNILSSMTLPFEGLNYLRACYTFAGELRNYSCDYSDRQYCFRELDQELRLRINNCLALIAANNSYPRPFDPSYPWLDELNACYARILHTRPAQEFDYPSGCLSLDEEEDAPGEALQRGTVSFSVELGNVSSFLTSRIRQGAREGLPERSGVTEDFVNKFCQNLELEPELCRIPARAAARGRQGFVLSIPDFARISFWQPPEAGLRPAAFVYASGDPVQRAVFPCIIQEGEDMEAILHSPCCRRQLEYLRGEGLDSSLQLFFSLFFGLIIENACCGCSQERSALLLKMLRLEYRAGGGRELLFIAALHFALFGLRDHAKSGTLPDPLVLQGLLNHVEILDFALFRLYLKYREQAAELPLFAALAKLKCFAALCRRVPGLEEFVRSDLLTPRVFEYVLVLCEQCPERPLVYFRPKNNPVPANCRLSFRGCARFGTNIRLVLEQVFIKNTIFPLLNPTNLENFTGLEPGLRENVLPALEKIFAAARNRLKYLAELAPDEPSLAGDLLAGRDCGKAPERIHARLAERTFSDLREIRPLLGLKDTPGADCCVSELLSCCGLIMIPGISALPPALRPRSTRFRITAIEHSLAQDQLLAEKLRAAQLVLLVFKSASGMPGCAQQLAEILDLRGERYKFALKFLTILEKLTEGCPDFGDEVYVQIGHECSGRGRSSDYRRFLIYLRILLRSAGKAGIPFRARRRMDYICRIFHMPGEHWFELYPEYRTASRLAAERPGQLDRTLIRSRLEESRDIQNVIAKIREEQECPAPVHAAAVPAAAAAAVADSAGAVAAASGTAAAAMAAPGSAAPGIAIAATAVSGAAAPGMATAAMAASGTVAPGIATAATMTTGAAGASGAAAPAAVVPGTAAVAGTGTAATAAAMQTAAKTPATAASVPAGASAPATLAASASGTRTPLPAGVVGLLEALGTEQRESMDLSEFDGLCVSLKFMSGAAAVEELNELSFEKFDEPLCEVSLEEHCIYLNHELTGRLLESG